MAKTTPWVKIKAEYLQGVTPAELSEKYSLTAKQISDKANKEKWTTDKSEICEKVRDNVQSKIDKITSLALKRLEDVLSDENTKTNDLVSAIGKAIDISGLKSSKQEITGKNGEALAIQKEYILPGEVKKFKEHYKQVVRRK